MFEKVGDAEFVRGEHAMLRFWKDRDIFRRLRDQNAEGAPWSFIDGPMTANNPMGVHHAWGRTYKDTFQRYWAMNGRALRYQNGFDCQGLWVEVEVEKQLGLGAKSAIEAYGVDKFVWECKKRVLKYAAIQTEQSVRLGYWMEWDDPATLRRLAAAIGTDQPVDFTPPKKPTETIRGPAEQIVERLGNPEWGGSYFTFSTENNETIWTFLKTCFERGKVYRGHDVMPWSGRGGSAYSQMEVADGRKLTVHRALFVRLPILRGAKGTEGMEPLGFDGSKSDPLFFTSPTKEYLLVWTTTPWTLTSNVAAMVNPDLDYVKLQAKRDGAIYYFAKENLEFQRLAKEFKEGFGRPEWMWPEGVPKLKTLAQIFKEQGGYETLDVVKGADLIGWRYRGPFDDLPAQSQAEHPSVSDLYYAEELIRREGLARAVHGSTVGMLIEALYMACYDYTVDLTASYQATLGKIESEEDMMLAVRCRTDAIIWKQFQTLIDILKCLRAIHPDDRKINFDSEFGETLRLAVPTVEGDGTISCDGLWMIYFEKIIKQLYTNTAEWMRRPKSSAESHRIIDGGRDFKGSPNVVAGEGTGIVHSAPGCGDVDHAIGSQYRLATIAPLNEDGTFMAGFGPFTGKSATADETVDLVIEELKKKGLLVYVEKYPHIYPFCWRTGDELVFRLVDEWFIKMDWRQEIIDVVREIVWLPDSIQGKEREAEWLTNMRDWMISKKRFWGLALPIWIDPGDLSHFEVFGSLKELKEAYDQRGGEGWEAFEGHTPHKPWIDAVKLRNPKTGNLMSRIPDVGNPWLDAGIVPFSTLGFNTDQDYWRKWFPADLVTECFPGQFRNWFYSLLALSTMMQWKQPTAADKKPFKTLLGHRLVMNEAGKPMHKSDGTAIWFEEAAEQLGVDTMRWMYLQQNPAQDLRFGTRHKDQPVTLETVDGPRATTIDGVPTCKVESGPADEVRRQVLLPLWNSYSFFVNYARLDGFDPTQPEVPFAQRPQIDQWILTNLQYLIEKMRKSIEHFDTPSACAEAATFIDDLSNWYIRRNRRRFWRSSSAGMKDFDKLAAYQTLYLVLTTLTKLLAPMVPFLAERMYRNLVTSISKNHPESVHLCEYPCFDEGYAAEWLMGPMKAVQEVVQMGHRLRETANLRVRQPLDEIRIASRSPVMRGQLSNLQEIIQDELNVKKVTLLESLGDLVTYVYRANLASLGKRYGKFLPKIREFISALDPESYATLNETRSLSVVIDGQQIDMVPDDVDESVVNASGWSSCSGNLIAIALNTALTPALIREGMSRDFVRHVQQLRKDADLEIEQRIRITYLTDDAEVAAMLAEFGAYIQGETLADQLVAGTPGTGSREVTVGQAAVVLGVVVV